MKFLLDVNIPPSLGDALRLQGHSARHAAKEGFPTATDIELIAIAEREGEIIITHDLDFGQLLAFSGSQYPSVIIFRIHEVNSILFEQLLVKHWEVITEPLLKGAILIIDEDRIRIRKLPIE